MKMTVVAATKENALRTIGHFYGGIDGVLLVTYVDDGDSSIVPKLYRSAGTGVPYTEN